MKYLLINHAQDGTHFRLFNHKEAAIKALSLYLPHARPLAVGLWYTSDWGNQLIIAERPDDWSVKKEERYKRAYDARETGTASPKQLKLLEEIED